jgi:hypothetical protein
LAPVSTKNGPKTLKSLLAALRASLSFLGFSTGGAVPKPEAEKLQDQIERISRTLPPKSLRTAEAKARLDLDKAQRAIRRWELDSQVKLAKAERDIAQAPQPRPVRGWS